MLVAANASIDSKSKGLVLAAGRGNVEPVRVLVAARAMSGFVRGLSDDAAALMCASQGCHTPVARMLVAARANVELKSYNVTALGRACARGHVEIVRVLVAASASIDSRSEGLVLAADSGNVELVRMVAASAHFNFVIDGTTALMRASAGGHTQVVRMLAAARANVDLGS